MRLITCIISFAATAIVGLAAPVDLSPPATMLGHADERGQLRYVINLGSIYFSDGGALPLRLDFSSARAGEEKSPAGWDGWFCGALQARAEFYGGNEYLRVTLLCAKQLYMKRDSKNAARYVSQDGSWIATITGNVILVERVDSWQLRFVDGDIVSLRTDAGGEFAWVRQNGKLFAIREKGSEAVPAKIEWKDGRIAAIQTVERRYTFTYANEDGKEEDGGFLSQIQWPRSSAAQAQYSFVQSANSLRVQRDALRPLQFTWDAETKRLTTDGLHIYKLEQPNTKNKEQGTKNKEPSTKNPKLLLMTDSRGETIGRSVDSQSGRTRIRYADGHEMIIYRITRHGSMFGAIGRVDYLAGEEKFTLLRNHFDSIGRVSKRTWLGSPFMLKGYAGGRYDAAFNPQKSFEPSRPTATIDRLREKKPVEIQFAYSGLGLLRSIRVGDEEVVKTEHDAKGNVTRRWVKGRFEEKVSVGNLKLENGEEKLENRNSKSGDGKGPRVREVWLLAGEVSPSRELSKSERTLLLREELDSNGNVLERSAADGRRTERRYDDNGRLVYEKIWAPDGKSGISERRLSYDDTNRRATETITNLLTTRSEHFGYILTPGGELTARQKIAEQQAKTQTSPSSQQNEES